MKDLAQALPGGLGPGAESQDDPTFVVADRLDAGMACQEPDSGGETEVHRRLRRRAESIGNLLDDLVNLLFVGHRRQTLVEIQPVGLFGNVADWEESRQGQVD